jgi:hypothetical protein
MSPSGVTLRKAFCLATRPYSIVPKAAAVVEEPLAAWTRAREMSGSPVHGAIDHDSVDWRFTRVVHAVH